MKIVGKKHYETDKFYVIIKQVKECGVWYWYFRHGKAFVEYLNCFKINFIVRLSLLHESAFLLLFIKFIRSNYLEFFLIYNNKKMLNSFLIKNNNNNNNFKYYFIIFHNYKFQCTKRVRNTICLFNFLLYNFQILIYILWWYSHLIILDFQDF